MVWLKLQRNHKIIRECIYTENEIDQLVVFIVTSYSWLLMLAWDQALRAGRSILSVVMRGPAGRLKWMSVSRSLKSALVGKLKREWRVWPSTLPHQLVLQHGAGLAGAV